MTTDAALSKWNRLRESGEIVLEADEAFRQMVNHNPIYFITSRGRVFSVAEWHGKEWREMSYHDRKSKYAKTNGSSGHKQLSVGLSISKNNRPLFTVSGLMKEYFQLPQFNPAGETELDCHHLEPVQEGYTNNKIENLQEVGMKVHRSIITPLYHGKVTEGGMGLKNEEKFLEQCAKLLPPGKGLAIVSECDPETGEVKTVQGADLTEGQLERLISSNADVAAMVAANQRFCGLYQKAYQECAAELCASGSAGGLEVKGGLPVLPGDKILMKVKEILENETER